MSVLIYAESWDGKFKKSSFEAVSFGKKLAEKMGVPAVALCLNNVAPNELGAYGADKILDVQSPNLSEFNAEAYVRVIAEAASKEDANIVVASQSFNASYMSGLLAAKLDAAPCSNVVAIPEQIAPLVVRRKVFSNKGFAYTQVNSDKAVLLVAQNAIGAEEHSGAGEVESYTVESDLGTLRVGISSQEKSTGKVSLADADIVISAGRGLKGPENWDMIEELATEMGAATACSKPVSDLGWRPHTEHVGQTGRTVAANVYFAIGISGAIQHLAGINSSKYIVAINTDPEAPIFKAANYGIVGDAFEVVPKLIEKVKEMKSNS